MNSIYIKIFQFLFKCLFFGFTISAYAQNKIIDSINIENFYIDSMPLRTSPRTYYDMNILNQFESISSPCMNKDAIFLYRDRLNKLKSLKIENSIYNIYYTNFFFMTGIGYGLLDENEIPIILQRDIDGWEMWLNDNKERICWDKERNLIYIKKN